MSKSKLKDPNDLNGVFFKISAKDDDIIEILHQVKDRSAFIKNAMVFYYKALKQNPSLVERSIVIEEYDIPMYIQQPVYSNQAQFMQNSPMMNNAQQIEDNNKVDNEENNTSIEEDEEDDINSYNNQDIDW